MGWKFHGIQKSNRKQVSERLKVWILSHSARAAFCFCYCYDNHDFSFFSVCFHVYQVLLLIHFESFRHSEILFYLLFFSLHCFIFLFFFLSFYLLSAFYCCLNNIKDSDTCELHLKTQTIDGLPLLNRGIIFGEFACEKMNEA